MLIKSITTKFFSCLILAVIVAQSTSAQDTSLLKMLDDSMNTHAAHRHVTGTFKAALLINGHTVESPARGVLNFEIQHRFGALNSGSYNFFGLDNANLRLGFDYGICDRLAVGIGRSSLGKTFDGYLKYKLLRQSDADNSMPVSVSVLGTVENFTQKDISKPYLNANRRTSYTGQLIIARKFKAFSLQLTPTYLHMNLVPTPRDYNDVFALTAGARVKLTRRMSLTGEYSYLPDHQVASITVHNALSLGWEMETGGHVFQLVFCNSQSMITSQYLTQTTGSWGNGDIYFGFNIARVFNLKKKK